MRGYASILALGLVLGACSGSEAATTTVASTTTAAPTTTTVVEATTTTTTTTTLPATTTTSAEVDGVPPEALALIGAPMPEVPEYPDGFDAEVWFEAYAAWNQWAFANPEEGLESLDLWVVPGSDFASETSVRLTTWLEANRRTVRVGSIELWEHEVADELGSEGYLVLNIETSVGGAAWVLEAGIVAAEQIFDTEDRRRGLVAVERDGERWLVSSWQQS